MQKQFINSAWFPILAVITCLAALALVVGSFTWMVAPVVPASSQLTKADVSSAVNSALDAKVGDLSALIPNVDLTQLTEVHDKLFEEDAWEATVLEFTSDELKSRDFKQAVFDKLNAHPDIAGDIDSWKDITSIVVKDTTVDDISKSDTSVDVTYELKVYYFIQGDKDETGRARVDVTMSVDGLDFDKEDYSDAEVDSTYVPVVVKVYTD